VYFFFCFFFSSRRRHTRCLSDWSSDVCSSDLAQASSATIRASGIPAEAAKENADVQLVLLALQPGEKTFYAFVIVFGIAFKNQRSEERRVGKECRSRGELYHE